MTCELPTDGQLHSLSEKLICLVTPEIQPIHAIIPAICIHNLSLRETDRNQTEHKFVIKICAGVRIGIESCTGVRIGVGIKLRQRSRNRNHKSMLESESESNRDNRSWNRNRKRTAEFGIGVGIVEAESNPGLLSTRRPAFLCFPIFPIF